MSFGIMLNGNLTGSSIHFTVFSVTVIIYFYKNVIKRDMLAFPCVGERRTTIPFGVSPASLLFLLFPVWPGGGSVLMLK